MNRGTTFASLASLFGVACTPADDASAVRAREVGGFSDAAIVVPPTDDAAAQPDVQVAVADASVEAEAVTLADAGAVDAHVAAAEAGTTASGAVHVALFAPRPVGAPPTPAPPKPPSGLGLNPPKPNCGAVSCGMTTPVKGPTVTVEVGLGPATGVKGDEVRAVAVAIATTRNRLRACTVAAWNVQPDIATTTVKVTVRAPGEGAESQVTIPLTTYPQQALRCYERAFKIALGGDEKPATLVFPIRITIER